MAEGLQVQPEDGEATQRDEFGRTRKEVPSEGPLQGLPDKCQDH